MKLIFCTTCQDIIKINYELTSCKCGHVKALYCDDGRVIQWNGNGRIIGVDNNSLLDALNRNPVMNNNYITTFLIPRTSPYVVKNATLGKG